MISRETIEKVLQTADIVEVIGEFVNLKRSGSNYKALCPFHKERTPSFVVSPAKQIFKCFGCGESGNVVTFLMKHEHMSFVEAIKYLAEKYGIPIEETEEEEDKQKALERESILALNKFAQKFFTNKLLFDDEGKSVGLSYLKHRGFSDEIILKFQLGYSPEQKDAFTQYALSQGYKLDLLAKSGLTIIKSDDKIFDRFWGRIIFPIHSMSGQILGFAGRTLRDDKSVAKYLNSPETEIFQKRKILYGIYFAKKAITKEDKCYLVEGYTDVMAFHQAGIENTVASLGTSLTEEQVNLIHRLTENLTLIFDGDNAGIKAALRGIDIALQENLNVRVVALPEGEDPDSFAKKLAPVDLKEFIEENEVDFITFKTKFLLQEAGNDPIEKAKVINEVVRSISVVPDPIKRSVFVKQAAEVLGLEEEVLYAELKKLFASKIKKLTKKPTPTLAARKTPVIPEYVEVKAPKEEREILYYLIRFGNYPFQTLTLEDGSQITQTVAEFIVTELRNENLSFSNMKYQKLFEEVLALLEEGKPLDFKYFVSHPDPDIQQIAAEVMAEEQYEISKIWERRGAHIHLPSEHYKENVFKAMVAFKMKLVNEQLNNLIKTMQKTPPDNLELVENLMSQYDNLLKIRSNLNNLLGRARVLFSK